jgi:hypothetical protein
MRLLACALLLSLAFLAPAAGQSDEPFEVLGLVTHPPIAEMSGIARSRTYEDVWWVMNDSGDSARLFAIDGKGNVIRPPWVAAGKEWGGLTILLAANVDWEDIAVAGDRIYVAETGNNGNARRDLGVYVVNEPNPRATEQMRPLLFLPIRYPDQKQFPAEKWHFDCESLFVSEGKLYFITKHRQPGEILKFERGAKLYRLDTEHLDRENVLTLVESRDDLALPTAADLSPDGTKLAVVTAISLWVFDKPAKGDRWLSGRARRLALPRMKLLQAEGVTWDDDETLRLSNEQRGLFRVKLSALAEVK